MNLKRRGKSRSQVWTAAETAKLRRLYPDHPQREVARILGRTLPSIQSRARLLRLRRTRNYRVWTPAEQRELRRLYPDHFVADLARRFHRTVSKIYTAAARYGAKKSETFLRDHCRMKPGSRIGQATQFKKGQVPANKGLRRPGWAPGRMAETQFKKGDRSFNYLPIGTVRSDTYGYLRVKIADGLGGDGNQKVWAFVHRRVWEAAHGPISPGHRLWWKDGNHRNCALENLELLTDQEHMARTTIHNLPPEVRQVIQLNGALKRRIARLEEHGEEHHHRSERPPLRDARRVEGQRSAVGT